jgi:dienelactone hydrolase
MGTIILILALVIEATFATYCIITKSDQPKVRNTLRIGAFAAFLILALVSVIQWGSLWYGLALLLFIWAALGVWAMFPKREAKEFKSGRRVFKALGTVLLVFLVLIPELIFPQHKLPRVTGKHPVATVNFTYTDKSRVETFTQTGENRQLNLQCWYPKDDSAKYPLVVFSHGAFGMKTANLSTIMELSSNGYVVCSIDHPYHALMTTSTTGKRIMVDPAFFQEVGDVNNGKYDEAAVFKIEQKWLKLRTTDINFVLDTILAQTRDPEAEEVYQRIDPGKIGLIGHSLGAASSAQVARERSDIAAVVDLDSDLVGDYLDYAGGKYVMNTTPYPVPLLVILADDITRLIDALPDADRVVAEKIVIHSAPNAFEVHIAGTDHQSLTDLPIVSPFIVSMITTAVKKAGGGETADKYYVIEKMNDLALTFFNVYLKGQGSFQPAKNY